MKSYYQISLDVEGRPCLVVGGGEEALEKTGRLLEAGAAVTVVSPRTVPDLDALARAGRVAMRRRAFVPEDVEGMFLVQNCVKSDPALSESLFALCRERRILLGAWDQPALSDFTMPALVRRGPLRVAISTGGAGPALSGALRRELEAVFDDEFVAYLEWLAARRQRAGASGAERAQRAALAREDVRGLHFEGRLIYPAHYRCERDEERGPARDDAAACEE